MTTQDNLELQFENLIEAYQAEMRAYKLGVTSDTIGLFLTLPAQISRALHGQTDIFSNAISLRGREVRLMQAEMRAEGREIAYIASARQRFAQS